MTVEGEVYIIAYSPDRSTPLAESRAVRELRSRTEHGLGDRTGCRRPAPRCQGISNVERVAPADDSATEEGEWRPFQR